jgi:hypothetical protein
MRRWATAAAAVTVIPFAATLGAAPAERAAAATPRVTTRPAVESVQAAPTIPRGAAPLGLVPAAAQITGEVILQPRDRAAVQAFVNEVNNKNSAQFHQYLVPGQFAARFGPLPSAVAAVTSQLRADGLQVSSAAGKSMFLQFRGPASRVETAFGTGLRRYHLADGTTGQATTSSVQLPSAIAGSVAAVVGLNDLVRLRPADMRRPVTAPPGTRPAVRAAPTPSVTGAPAACPSATTAATDAGGLTDDQIAKAYGAFGLYQAGDTGAGQHIAVYELEPFQPSDLEVFDSCYFGPAMATTMAALVNVIAVDGGQPAGPGTEAILDVEDVSALAPGANLDVYEAPNTTAGAIDEYANIVNADTDQVVTTSWGLCESALQQAAPGIQQAENLLFEQAAAQGQSVFAAAGDSGSNDCNRGFSAPVSPVLSVDDPGSQPYVVSVGGTTIDDATQPPSEHVWNDGAQGGGGGGGISESWPMPSWQLDARVPGILDPATISAADAVEATDSGNPAFAFCQSDAPGGATETACRQVPDVSAQADEFTGAITIYSAAFGPGQAGWTTIGGTSSATPIWAALLALVNVSNTSSACSPHSRGVGFVSPLLYGVASNGTQYGQSFNDITAGGNDPFGFSDLFPATKGYDMASGLGSPELTSAGGGAGLAANLCDAAVSLVRPVVTDLTPNVVTTAGDVPITIHGSGFAPGGIPDVADVQVGTYQLPTSAASFTVVDAGTITALVPPAALVEPPGDTTDGAGGYQVSVTLGSGETSLPSPGGLLEYVDPGSGGGAPAVTSVRTFVGPEAGGNSVDIFGSGFTGATAVTFGNVAATTYDVVNDTIIQATVPAISPTTVCAQDGSFFHTGETSATDICQVQVVVVTPQGSSRQYPILPLYEGPISPNLLGVMAAPSGEEVSPQPAEYDYLPAPTITSISTSRGPASLASEFGGTLVTLKGTGFNPIGLDFVTFGDPTQEFSQDPFIQSATGTEIQVFAPPAAQLTVGPAGMPVSVITAVATSPALFAEYAGVPVVNGLVVTRGPTAMRTTAKGTPGGPDTGGTPISLSGVGFTEAVGVAFVDTLSPFSIGTQHHFTVTSDEAITTRTVPQNPAIVDVEVCTVTFCSFDPNADEFILFPPGAPNAQSATPASGPATGGTAVVISGANLGCVAGVSFGSTPARSFSNPLTPVSKPSGPLDCGQTTAVDVMSPPLPAGTKLPKTVVVTVTTDESVLTRGRAVTTASFTYEPIHPALLADSPPGTGTVAVAYAAYRFRANGDPVPTFSVSSGGLPPGLTLNRTTGVLAGRPTRLGLYRFRVTAANGAGPAAVSPPILINIRGR